MQLVKRPMHTLYAMGYRIGPLPLLTPSQHFEGGVYSASSWGSAAVYAPRRRLAALFSAVQSLH